MWVADPEMLRSAASGPAGADGGSGATVKVTVRVLVFAVSAVAMLVGFSPAASAWTDSISGRVVDVDGQPLSGITVVLANSTGDVIDGRPRTVTDAAGRYVFVGRQLNAATVTIVPSDPAFAGTYEYVRADDPHGADVLVDDLVYHRKGSVSGTITVDAPSSERTAVWVSIERWDWWPVSNDLLVDEIHFDGSGSLPYRIDGVPAGSYRLYFGMSRGAGVYYPGATTSVGAEPVDVAPTEHVSGLDASLTRPPDTLVGVGPTRLADTRASKPNGVITVPKVRVSPARPLRLEVAGVAGIPATGVDAVALNVTATGAVAGGHLSAVPCGAPTDTSTLNFRRIDAVSNTTVVSLDGSGALCLHASTETDVVVDLAGFVRAAAGFDARTPVRLVDTRPGRPALDQTIERTRVGPGHATKVIDLDVVADREPGDVLSLNVTATGASIAGFVALYPCRYPIVAPLDFSMLNYAPGATTANAVMYDVDGRPPDEDMCITSSSPVDVIVDVTSVLRADSTFGSALHLGRLYDTRPGRPSRQPNVVGKIGGTRVLRLPAQVIRGVAMFNVTVTNTASSGHVTAYACDRPRPATSNLNYTARSTVASLVYVPLPVRGGDVCIYAASPVDVVIDAVGGFTSAY